MVNATFFDIFFLIYRIISNVVTKGKQRALSLDIWTVLTMGTVIGYSCV